MTNHPGPHAVYCHRTILYCSILGAREMRDAIHHVSHVFPGPELNIGPCPSSMLHSPFPPQAPLRQGWGIINPSPFPP